MADGVAMVTNGSGNDPAALWHLLGGIGAIVFYSRFWIQWIASERRGESTVPVSFWYLSSVGTLTLLVYAVITQSPLGALGQCVNIGIYTRNLVLIWRKKSTIGPRFIVLIQFIAGIVVVISVGFVVMLWVREFGANPARTADMVRQAWFWLGIGLVGQVLFSCRFLIQWVASERRGESVVPPVFWYLSVVASTLQAACFFQRHEWLFMIGMVASTFIYLRNIVLLKRSSRRETIAP